MRRVGLILLGLALGVVALEGALRVGTLVVRATGREQGGAWLTRNRRILTLGDSNTYGFLVEPEQAYPKVLEREWNVRGAAAPIEVLNVAYPGMNSSQIRATLPRFAALFHPDVITVMIGTNDFWTVPQSESASGDLGARLRNWAWRHLRVYRLFHMIGQSVRQPRLEVSDGQPPLAPEDRAALIGDDEEARRRVGEKLQAYQGPMGGKAEVRFGDAAVDLQWGRQDGGVADWKEALARNVAAVADEGAQLGIPVLLITYPSGNAVYGVANAIVRQTAQARGIPLVDLEAVFRPRCPQWRCAELFPDQHPSPAGHALAADTVAQGLHQQLGW